MKKQEIKKEFETEVLDISRVERMTKGGRRLKFRSLVVSGNKNGKVGIGKGKGRDAQDSIEKATKESQRKMITVPINEEGTIPHEIKAKFGAAVVLLKPQSSGRGIVAGGTVRSVCAMCGIKNVSGKMITRTRNKINNAKATMEALKMLKSSDK
jgi:small subunit ribosomal protein S5